MNRAIVTVADVFSASSLLLIDSAIKGTALLILAALAAGILRRDSAATRHLVWLMAIIALLIVPALSTVLPQWRVLPDWAGFSPKPVVEHVDPPPIARPTDSAIEAPQNAARVEDEPSSAIADQPAAEWPTSSRLLATPKITSELAVWSWDWTNALSLVWAVGFSVLLLRLIAARLMLWKTEGRGTIIGSPSQPAKEQAPRIDGTIVTAFNAACLQLGIGRPVILLIHPDKAIPIVWGILRCRLLLPAAARHWSGEQLRTVLLHELAHIERRDALTQMLAQVACALHWFNPLAWFAAWRLGVECERACDDLVLASGVRPSAYAGYLLEVVSDFSPIPWTKPGGLAMARKSSLEGRLVAVLSENQSRRSTSVALAAIGLAIAIGIAAPIAMLRAADEKSAEKSNYRATDETLTEATQAVGEIRFPPPKPDALRGLDLSTVAVRAYESAYRSLPDLYGPYSEKPWSGSYPKNVFQMPLAEHTWLKYPAGSGHFYIEYRHDGTPQSEQIYGPIEGDPFEVLKLEELLREQMKPGATSGDPRYRLRLMFRTGEPGLVRRAWRMIEPELAFKFTARDGNYFQRYELFEGVRDALRDRAEAFLSPELKDVAAQAQQRVEAAEAEFDALNGFGDGISADDRYESVTYLQPKIAATIPEPLWGKPLDGLRLGLAPREWTSGADWNELPLDTPLPTSVTVEAGQEQSYQLVVENVSDHDITLCGYLLGEEQHRTLEVLDRNGQLVETHGRHTSTPSSHSYWRLKPGERQLLSMPAVHFMTAQSNDPNQGLGYFVKAPPGVYTLRASYRFGLYDNARHRHIPAQGIWVGQLTTGSQKFTLADSAGTKDKSARGERGPKSKDNTKLSGRLFIDAAVRTTKDEKQFSQSAISIDPNTGSWTRLLNYSESGFTVPLSPVRVSPDGRTMLFTRDKEIWKCDAKTGENPARAFQQGQPKAWSPDGKEFIAVVEKDASRGDSTENWRVSADGQKQLVLPLPIGEVIEDWSADGRWLVGWSHADGQLYIVKPDGSGRRRLTNSIRNASRIEHPRFSPDGRRIVYLQTLYQGDDGALHSRFSLRTINVDGTDDREILGEKAVRPAPAKAAWTAPMAAQWSPDGRHLAVVFFDHARDGGILAINGNWRLAIIDADGGNLRELKLESVLTTVLQGDGPEWRPDAAAVVTRDPTQGANLQPGIEEKLQWGEPASGLRAALVRPAALGESEAPEVFDLKLVVQNVSDASIRFNTTSAAPKNPFLLLRKDGVPLAAFTGSHPTLVDFMLQPREVAVVRMFPEPTEGQSIVKEEPNLTFSVKLEIENAPTGAWTGKLVTGEMAAAYSAHGLLPKHKEAQSLFKVWNANARGDGKIPGALIGLLAESVTTFTKNNPTWETTPQLLKMLPRFDASRDWGGQDALALLDELAAAQGTPIKMAVGAEYEQTIQTGAPLPSQLADAPWGEAHPSGLRLAYLLEPRAAEHRLDTPLKGRILIHNAGKQSVVFRTRTWHQNGHKATDAKGSDINISSTHWTTLGRLVPFRLAPGEFVEVNTAGIGVGANKDAEDWQNTRVGSWIEAKEGDEVTVTTAPVPLSDWNEELPLDGQPRWWLDHIIARLSRRLPLPTDSEARKVLLYRVAMELFGTPVSEGINAAFVADREPTALDSLAKRLAHRPGLTPFVGDLTSGTTKFRVLPADPDAANRPRTASNPGRYTLRDGAVLAVTRRPDGERIVNEASIQFSSSDPTNPAPGGQYQLKLPDGYDTWAAAWVRGGTVLWVQEKGTIHSYNFTNPAQIRATTFEGPAKLEMMPKPVVDALHATLVVPDGPKPASGAPATPKK